MTVELVTSPKKRSQFSTPAKSKMVYISPTKLQIQLSTPEKANHIFITPKKLNLTPKKKETYVGLEFPETHTPVVSPEKVVNEIGPTPQHAGKVLGILDVQAFTPFKSSIKKSEPLNNRQKSGGLDDCPAINNFSGSETKNDQNKMIPITPVKPTVIIESSTPSYFHNTVAVPAGSNNNDSESDSDEDIGLPKKKMRLAGVIEEFKQRQAALKIFREIDEEEEIMRELEQEKECNKELDPEEFENFDPDSLGEFKGDDNELNPEQSEGYRPFKKKGQKRTTRRVVSKFSSVFSFCFFLFFFCFVFLETNDHQCVQLKCLRQEVWMIVRQFL